MSALNIIEHATLIGVQLEAKGKNIIVHNADHLTDELRQEIRLHKPEIIRLLSANDEHHRLSDVEVADILREASSGIEIDVQQFWAFLDESDIVDIRMGAIPLENLKAFAKSWARYPELVPIGNRRPFPTLNEAGPLMLRRLLPLYPRHYRKRLRNRQMQSQCTNHHSQISPIPQGRKILHQI
ncbi:MAG: hypothetical protein ACQ9MH_15715 [Nitrospinales bacterium]